MTVVANTFRQQFTEFADPLVYSDTLIGTWVTTAAGFVDPTRWDTMADYGTSLYVAHNLAMSGRDQLTAQAGGVPGSPHGVLTSKGVRGVTASFSADSLTTAGDGAFNSTRYGIEFMRLSRLIGAGGYQATG
jgi:hypothetical protein